MLLITVIWVFQEISKSSIGKICVGVGAAVTNSCVGLAANEQTSGKFHFNILKKFLRNF